MSISAVQTKESTTRFWLILVLNIHLLSKDDTKVICLVASSVSQLSTELENEESLSDLHDWFAIFICFPWNFLAFETFHLNFAVDALKFILFENEL